MATSEIKTYIEKHVSDFVVEKSLFSSFIQFSMLISMILLNLNKYLENKWLFLPVLLICGTLIYRSVLIGKKDFSLNSNGFMFSVSLLGISWGLFIFSLLFSVKVGEPLFVLALYMMGGMSATSMSSLGYTRKHFIVFNVLLFSVGNSYFAIHTDLPKLYYAVPYFSFAYLGFLFKLQKVYFQSWCDSLIKSYENKEIINSFPGGISVIKKGQYVAVNQWVLDSIGVSEDKIIGKSFGFMDQSSPFMEAINKFKNSSLIQSMDEIVLKTKNGPRRHLVLFKKLLSESDSLVVGSVDIHDLRESQKELEFHKAQLEITAKMATLGEMSSGLAHEINNPLTAILGKAQTILRETKDDREIPKERLQQHADRIVKLAERIFTIVRGLRNLARGDHNNELQFYSLHSIFADTLALAESKLKVNSVELETNLGTDLEIECHPVQISQVFLNVINNACDAISGSSNAWIKVDVIPNPENAMVLITDSGNGISEELRESILKPFFTTKEIGKGTGLGLSISKGIIEAHGGEFYFDHNHKNTRVVIKIPYRQNSKKDHQLSTSEDSKEVA